MFSELLKKIKLPKLENIICILTLVLFIKHAPAYWYAKGPTTVLCITALVFPILYKQAFFWLLLASITGSVVFNNWSWVDNHKYLEFYWLLTLFCIYSLPEQLRQQAFRINGALLLGGCMTLAVIWKAISVDYLDSSFFEYTLLTDHRFSTFASIIGRISDMALLSNRQELSTFANNVKPAIASIHLKSTQAIQWLAIFLTWWTIIIEAIIGIFFLVAIKSDKIRKIASWILVLFALSTYAIATVKSFAWLLLLLCLSQSREEDKKLNIALIATFLLIQIYTLPFGKVSEAIFY